MTDETENTNVRKLDNNWTVRWDPDEETDDYVFSVSAPALSYSAVVSKEAFDGDPERVGNSVVGYGQGKLVEALLELPEVRARIEPWINQAYMKGVERGLEGD